MDNKILVSILTHRCQCPHVRLKRGGDRGGATHIHKRKLSSEPYVKKDTSWATISSIPLVLNSLYSMVQKNVNTDFILKAT